MKDNKKEELKPVLVPQLLDLLSKHESTYNQKRVFYRACALVMSELFAFGRHTIAQLLLTLGLTEEDWTAWYRLFSEERFQEEEAAKIMLSEMLAQTKETDPFVVGSDGFHVPRRSQKMPGTGWMRGLQTARFRPGIQRGQRFVETSWLPPVVEGYSRAIPFRCLPAFTQKSVPAETTPPKTEVEATLETVVWVREQMDAQGRENQQLVVLVDGRYDTLSFWAGLPHNTVAVARSARNRALYYLPRRNSHGNRKYGRKAAKPSSWLHKRKGFKRTKVMVRGQQRRMRYRIQGPYIRNGEPDVPLFLIVVGGGKRPAGSRRKNYDPCFFLVSAIQDENGKWVLPYPRKQILTWLWQRWELEIAHRQMKSGLGLGEKQCWHEKSTVTTVQWSVWVYSLMLLTGHLVWGNEAGPKPPGLWRRPPRRWSFNTLWRAFRAELWGFPDFRASWTATQGNWPRFETHLDSLFNATLASARV